MIKIDRHYPSMGGTRIELDIDGSKASIYLLPNNTIEVVSSGPYNLYAKKDASNSVTVEVKDWNTP